MPDTAAINIRPPAGQDWLSTRSGAFAPSSADDATRTVQLMWTTGATARRVDWFDGKYDEQLVVDQKAVRLDRLNNGASLLDSHRALDGVRNILGVVERAWIDGSTGRAAVRFSDRADVEPVWRDVKAGVSVGYRIHRAEKVERKADVPLVRVVDWEPMELSLVPVPADAGEAVRNFSNMQRSYLARQATRLGYRYVDATGPLADIAAKSEEPLYFPASVHLTAAGDKAIARILAVRLKELWADQRPSGEVWAKAHERLWEPEPPT